MNAFRASDWSTGTRALVEKAGWYPDRRVDLPTIDWPGPFVRSTGSSPEQAERIVQEFGGLRVDPEGPGIECARTSFEIDPSLALGEEDRFRGYEERFGIQLIPIGEAGDGEAFLAADDAGRTYLALDAFVALVGHNIYEAIEALVVGRRPKEVPLKPNSPH
jgi:hypothetical protein